MQSFVAGLTLGLFIWLCWYCQSYAPHARGWQVASPVVLYRERHTSGKWSEDRKAKAILELYSGN